MTNQDIIDTLVRGKVVDKIARTTVHGFGDVTIKVFIQNNMIKTISLIETETIKL